MSEIPGCSAGVHWPVQRWPPLSHYISRCSLAAAAVQTQLRNTTQQHNNTTTTTTMSRVSAISCLLASNLATSLASVAVGLGQINPGETVKFNIHPYREKIAVSSFIRGISPSKHLDQIDCGFSWRNNAQLINY